MNQSNNMDCVMIPSRFLEADDSCVEYGCSYTKEESPGDVFCFEEGPYPTEAGRCPTVGAGAKYFKR